jgi:hypothetical protein
VPASIIGAGGSGGLVGQHVRELGEDRLGVVRGAVGIILDPVGRVGHVRILVGTSAVLSLLAELVDLAVQRLERGHQFRVRLAGGSAHLRGGACERLDALVDGGMAVAFRLFTLGVLPHLACWYAHGSSLLRDGDRGAVEEGTARGVVGRGDA